jgi:Fe-S-cluster containining protein
MPGVLCEHCTAVCCQYVALPIDTPRTRAQFDDIRWYLLHENISVFVEDGDWYISMHTRCRHLQADGRCGIYATRPRICRSYSTKDCDYHSGDYGWEAHFTCAEHLDAYVNERFSKKLNKPIQYIMDHLDELEESYIFSHTPQPRRNGHPPAGGRGRLALPILPATFRRAAGGNGTCRRRAVGGRAK